MKGHRIWKGLTIAMFCVAVFVVVGFAVMHLWNWLVPAVFGLRAITFTQALGLLILCKILFGGFHRRGGGGRGWKRQMGERWSHMSPEERVRMRAGMRGRWGCGFRPERETVPEQKPAV